MKRFVNIVWLLSVVWLAGCGESGVGFGTQKAAHIEGIVTERDEPVTQGKIEAKDKNGKTVASAELQGTSNYAITLPANAAYPVTLEILVDDSLLEAVVMDATSVQQDISTMSTLVVQSARNLGGITKGNMAQAAINAIRQNKKSSGKGTSTGFKGDPTKQYGGWH